MIIDCLPQEKIIADLGSGKDTFINSIDCKNLITLDINPLNSPDIICDFNKGIPLGDNTVDIVVAGEVLEHLYFSKKFISELSRVLKNSGILILSVPNICSLKYRIAFLLGKIPSHAAKADCFYQDERPGHIRDYNFEEVRNLLKSFKFRIILEKSDCLSFKSRTIIPGWILPRTFGDTIIVKAEVIK
ncbi:MAG: methyltransferase domain-containing protein [Bacteroidales bacterium]|nr:methyltransferase domain-containing protein [Bacteroidales bacterium]